MGVVSRSTTERLRVHHANALLHVRQRRRQRCADDLGVPEGSQQPGGAVDRPDVREEVGL
jgi:hypothetical protein